MWLVNEPGNWTCINIHIPTRSAKKGLSCILHHIVNVSEMTLNNNELYNNNIYIKEIGIT